MIWFGLYIIGVIISTCLAGFLNRGNSLTEEECKMFIAVIAVWPLTLVLTIVIGMPILLFAVCKGELDDEIKQGFTWLKANVTWLKTKWNSLGD